MKQTIKCLQCKNTNKTKLVSLVASRGLINFPLDRFSLLRKLSKWLVIMSILKICWPPSQESPIPGRFIRSIFERLKGGDL